jgi:hypothetical protein
MSIMSLETLVTFIRTFDFKIGGRDLITRFGKVFTGGAFRRKGDAYQSSQFVLIESDRKPREAWSFLDTLGFLFFWYHCFFFKHESICYMKQDR